MAAATDVNVHVNQANVVAIHCDGHAGSDHPDLQLGLAWDLVGDAVDLDCAAVAFDSMGVLVDACFYGQLSACSDALKHSGDQRSGDADGFDEVITLDVDKVAPVVDSVVFVVNVHSDGHDFTQVETATATLQNFLPGETAVANTLATLDLGCNGRHTGVIVGMIKRGSGAGDWQFYSINKPCASGRNFQECMPSIRAAVDSLLPEWTKHERTLTMDKTFDMCKSDTARLPADLDNVSIGLGWDCSGSVDLDASIIVLDRARSILNTVYFGNRTDAGRGIFHSGDNTTGDGAGDDEVINVSLKSTGISDGDSLVAVVNVYSSGASFGKSVRNAYVRLFAKGHTLAKYKLDSSVKSRGFVFCELVYTGGTWRLTALGEPCGGSRATDSACQSVVQKIRTSSGTLQSPSGQQHEAIPQDSPTSTSGCCTVQ